MTQQGANYSATFDPSWVTPLHTNQTFDASRSLDISLTQTYFLLQSVQLALGGFLESSLHQVDPVGCQKNTLGAALVAVCHPRNLIGPHPCSVLCPLAQNRDSTPHPGGVLWSVVLFAAMVTVPEAGRGHRRTTERYPVVEAEAEAQRPDVTERKTSAGPRVPLPMLQEAQRSIVIEKLTKNVTESHLREIFGGFGDIQSLDLPMNKAFMTNRGTAYILYHDPADAEAAIAHMHEAQLDGATLNFNIAEQALAAQDMAADPRRIVALQGHRHRLGNIAVLGIWKDMTSIGLALCRAPGRHAALDPFLQNPVQLHHRQGGHTRVWTAPNVAVAVARATAAMAIAVAAIGNGARA
ncbi:RNA-binding protein with serine-rich domain 1 [Aspergillus tubingensis]|uniref:RNA-binding protein with serine-rich domain 1 n=1 Tax=Aspergillus tubingensis TaxID=5068 RepID=UPI0015790200|nr:RNA-binding domain-containing protein [Aspergillus tubingensis]GFN10773.1 RNA-binding domain-containing protein [Aspergillus tubingensis]